MRSISIIFLLAVALLASSINSFFDSMKKQQDQYQDKNLSNEIRESLVKKLKISNEANLTKKDKETIDSLNKNSNASLNKAVPWISKNMMSGIDEKQLQPIIDSMTHKTVADEKVDTIFYFFSTSQSEYALYNFVNKVSKLESINKKLKYYGVVQGMLQESELEKLYKPFEFNESLGEKTIIKMHPIMYKDLNLKKVPAYLFSKCSIGEFKYKDCDNKFLVRGDITLEKALEIVSSEDKSYLDYLHLLEKGDY
ncbi:MAG: TrbC family F-type conjugative pilus assembly protein [Sulfurimonas sp.]|jgi:hypothetical protein